MDSFRLWRLVRFFMTLICSSWRILAVLLTATPWAVAQTAGSVREVGQLKVHHAAERTLETGQTDQYAVRVRAGQFVRVVARQIGVDVVVTILDPLGKI